MQHIGDLIFPVSKASSVSAYSGYFSLSFNLTSSSSAVGSGFFFFSTFFFIFLGFSFSSSFYSLSGFYLSSTRSSQFSTSGIFFLFKQI